MRFCLLFCCVLLFPAIGFTKPSSGLYSWTDEQGVVHYSSKPSHREAKRAALPEINRGEVKLVKKKLLSCGNHGGINCQSGADSDGSVICYDGFRDASPRFRFSCASPKLQITEISEMDLKGRFTVLVRNAKSIEANKPKVTLLTDDGIRIDLLGPNEIEAYGVAEFHFEPKDSDIPHGEITAGNFELGCENCS